MLGGVKVTSGILARDHDQSSFAGQSFQRFLRLRQAAVNQSMEYSVPADFFFAVFDILYLLLPMLCSL